MTTTTTYPGRCHSCGGLINDRQEVEHERGCPYGTLADQAEAAAAAERKARGVGHPLPLVTAQTATDLDDDPARDKVDSE